MRVAGSALRAKVDHPCGAGPGRRLAPDRRADPLWQLPAITAGLTLAVALPTGAWDAGLRVTGGCLLVGLTQAGLMAPLIRADERRRGRRYVRLPGSRILRGTRLGVVEHSS